MEIPAGRNSSISCNKYLRALTHFLGLDGSISLTLLGRFWTLGSGPITVFEILRNLSRSEQGYYYTFSSILGISGLLELGLSIALVQFVSHEFAHLSWNEKGSIVGGSDQGQRLAALIRGACVWYLRLALVVLIVTIPSGVAVFAGGTNQKWQIPWLICCVTTAFTCAFTPAWALIEGAGLVKELALIRLAQQVTSSLALWAALEAKLGLGAAAASSILPLVVGIGWLATKRRRALITLLRAKPTIHGSIWSKEIWPMQWRIATSTLMGFIAYQLPGPILFRFQGDVAAGRWGLSYTIASVLSLIGAAWISTKVPRFAILIASRKFADLDTQFRRALSQSTAVIAVLGASIWTLVFSAGRFGFHLELRVLDPLPFLALIVNAILLHLGFSMGSYLRAHKQEPYAGLAILNGTYMLAATLVVGARWGPNPLAVATAVGTAVVLVGGGFMIFSSKRKEWHSGGSFNDASIQSAA